MRVMQQKHMVWWLFCCVFVVLFINYTTNIAKNIVSYVLVCYFFNCLILKCCLLVCFLFYVHCALLTQNPSYQGARDGGGRRVLIYMYENNWDACGLSQG